MLLIPQFFQLLLHCEMDGMNKHARCFGCLGRKDRAIHHVNLLGRRLRLPFRYLPKDEEEEVEEVFKIEKALQTRTLTRVISICMHEKLHVACRRWKISTPRPDIWAFR